MLTMVLLTITVWVFWYNHTPLRSSMFSQIECELKNKYLTQVYAAAGAVYQPQPCVRTHKLNPFWFISWVISCASAVSAQLILSCHAKSRSRLQRVTSKFLDEINLSKKKSTTDYDDDDNSFVCLIMYCAIDKLIFFFFWGGGGYIKSTTNPTNRDPENRKITEFEPEVEMRVTKSKQNDKPTTPADTAPLNTTPAGQGPDNTQDTERTSTHPNSLEVNTSGGQESISPKEAAPQDPEANSPRFDESSKTD
ncbi:hypothetical protein RFI_11510 [Reticulomyxa filosa]|uniref:Uncharacterized protein n=1 Tax=Reticulomyxa filosa TaxID=46433 RepID=X6NH31_RETFI|nr:hypothetical protein RFI_11510 [Reticulomyxa filosa]|eukprot:ETO25625.1 hypothetical protein RFI_11510 [Reticulomyxa filosa]